MQLINRRKAARETNERGDEVAAKFRQLGVLPSSVMPEAPSGPKASVKASRASHTGLRGISNSTLDFDKVTSEKQQAEWHGARDLTLSCW